MDTDNVFFRDIRYSLYQLFCERQRGNIRILPMYAATDSSMLAAACEIETPFSFDSDLSATRG
jgi:hypothetical protein